MGLTPSGAVFERAYRVEAFSIKCEHLLKHRILFLLFNILLYISELFRFFSNFITTYFITYKDKHNI